LGRKGNNEISAGLKSFFREKLVPEREQKTFILLGSSFTGRAKDFPKFLKTGNALNKMELETIKKGIRIDKK
jgi:hypothetical protein